MSGRHCLCPAPERAIDILSDPERLSDVVANYCVIFGWDEYNGLQQGLAIAFMPETKLNIANELQLFFERAADWEIDRK